MVNADAISTTTSLIKWVFWALLPVLEANFLSLVPIMVGISLHVGRVSYRDNLAHFQPSPSLSKLAIPHLIL